jgi:glyoxylase-like metal-dependent hydrolase (beta-lactamase superfamily II)
MTQPQATQLPGLYCLPLPTPFPIGRINTYMALDEPLTLVDTGVNSERAYAELVEGLAALDVRPADLKRIIITHHHTDHLGLTGQLVIESGAEVWSHRLGVPYLEQPEDSRRRLGEWSVSVWQEGGAPQTLLDLTSQLFAWFGTLSSGPVPVARVLEDGDCLTLAGRSWTVLHTPGHAGDLICLHDPETGILLSSDHLLRDVSSNALVEPPLSGEKRPRRLLEYMAQLQRVADLSPAIAYGGHGAPARDVPGLIAHRLAFHQARADRIEALLRPDALTLYEVTRQVFPQVTDVEMFLALSEVLGHLDWLERDGRIVRRAQGHLTRWQAA